MTSVNNNSIGNVQAAPTPSIKGTSPEAAGRVRNVTNILNDLGEGVTSSGLMLNGAKFVLGS